MCLHTVLAAAARRWGASKTTRSTCVQCVAIQIATTAVPVAPRFHATLYHGTKSQYVPLIQQDGALPGSNDRPGLGVYFTTSFEKATAIANYHDPRGQNLPGCVITFRVNLGQRLKNLWDDETGARMQPLCCG